MFTLKCDLIMISVIFWKKHVILQSACNLRIILQIENTFFSS